MQLHRKSLLGLSIGDAFGDSFFGDSDQIEQAIYQQKIPATKWEFTDDTVMAIAIVQQLEQKGKIHQNELARAFANNYKLDNYRGYGGTAHRILRAIEEGTDWRIISQEVFSGMGSMGNGAAMRVAPVGAYFYTDFEKITEACRLSAVVTHAHEEAVAGAIAVGIAAALATQIGEETLELHPNGFIENVATYCPESDTKFRILKGLELPLNYDIRTVVKILGNGHQMLTQDTIPFAIWCAAHHLFNFEAALWKAVSALGDRDTICAIVGGIVALSAAETTIPQEWQNKVENYQTSIFWSS